MGGKRPTGARVRRTGRSSGHPKKVRPGHPRGRKAAPMGNAGRGFVSTGRLPDAVTVQRLVEEAHERFRTDRSGVTSAVYPALARASPDLFGVSVVSCGGAEYHAGDATHEF